MKRTTCLVLMTVALSPLVFIACGRKTSDPAASRSIERVVLSAQLATTWDDLMLLHAAKAVARDDVEFGSSLGKDFKELTATLSPRYLKDVPVHDAWGTPYMVVNGSVASAGSDRRFDQKTLKGDISIDRSTEDDHGGDLIEYYVYPKLGSVPTNASKPALLVRETVAVLDGGKFWVVQGLVANSSTNAHLFGTQDSATATWSCRETGQPAEVEVPKNIDAQQGDIDPLTPGNIGYFQILVKPRFSSTCTPVPTLAFHSGGQGLPYAIDPGAQPTYRN